MFSYQLFLVCSRDKPADKGANMATATRTLRNEAQNVTPLHAPKPQPVLETVENKAIHRADGREVRKHTIYLATEVSRKLTSYCAQTGKNLSGVIADAVVRYIDHENKKEVPQLEAAKVDVKPEEPKAKANPEGLWGLAHRVATPLLSLTRQVLSQLEGKGW
jgi:hypothetical protein